MSIPAVNGVSPATHQTAQPQAVTATPAGASFSQQLNAKSAQADAAHGHHHHHSGTSQSVTSSGASAASAAGATSPSSVASSLLKLLS